MASSTEERPPISRMSARPAKFLMASDPDGCIQLKDVLNREDATTMTATFSVPASNEEDSKPPHLTMYPGLLMAARDGNFMALENILMNRQEQQIPAESHIMIQMPEESNSNQPAPAEGANKPGDSAAEAGPSSANNTVHSVVTHVSTIMQPGPALLHVSKEIKSNPPDHRTGEGSNEPGNSISEDCQSDDRAVTPVSEITEGSTDIVEDDEHYQVANDTDANLSATADEDGHTPDPATQLLKGVTFDSEQDSALHVVAAFGNSKEYLKCAELIYNKAKHLLDAVNRKGETPLHLAAVAGNIDMVDLLIKMAASENGGPMRVKELLRQENKIGETVLHGAIRSGQIDLIKNLMSTDSELACIPNDNTSPLYLAILLRLSQKCVRKLFIGSRFSCSGPDGKNILHIAVSRKEVLQDLLEWPLPVQILTAQADIDGSTPLHFAASGDRWHYQSLLSFCGLYTVMYLGFSFWFLRHMTRVGPTTLLVEANAYSLYQPDKKGLYPIHVAAASGCLKAIIIMLEKSPSCATLRDIRGMTFLHIAVEKERWGTVAFVCRSPQFASILNLQDNNGNSALHLAVEVGNQAIFNCLFQNHRVRLDLSNKEGLTVMDLAIVKINGSGAIYNASNPRYFIQQAFWIAKAPSISSRKDHMSDKYNSTIDEARESQNLTNEAQVMGIVSVLVATVTFAAAFTLPGGYGANSTPTLAGSYVFDAFIISITLAFVCSLLATVGLIYSGFASFEYSIRSRYSHRSKLLLQSSVRSLLVAFGLGVYMVMAPVAFKTAITVCTIICVGLLYQNFEFRQNLIQVNNVLRRYGFAGFKALDGYPLFVPVSQKFWSLIVIFVLPAFWSKHHGTK